jgi:hypothetical protein
VQHSGRVKKITRFLENVPALLAHARNVQQRAVFRQIRRFSAGIRGYFKENQRWMAEKEPIWVFR